MPPAHGRARVAPSGAASAFRPPCARPRTTSHVLTLAGRSMDSAICRAVLAEDATAVKRYDFIIVGGGSAGCVLANRLSADPATSVLVLEAGRRDSWWDLPIHMPGALAFPIGNRFYDWKYKSEPEQYLKSRRIYHARGKLLGGSSSINGMIFQRGNPLSSSAATRSTMSGGPRTPA